MPKADVAKSSLCRLIKLGSVLQFVVAVQA